MTNELRNRVERMKEQTFGVEIEMNNITRKKAAEVVAEYWHTVAYDSASEFGYYSWACKDPIGRVWKFQRDISIVGNDDEKCEMVTPILTYEADMAHLQEIVRLLRHNGAMSSPSRGCGVHVHIGANGHTPQTLRHLVNIMASHESALIEALRVDSYRIDSYCRPVDQEFLAQLNRTRPSTMSGLADCWYAQSPYEDRRAHYNRSRYHILNLHATFTKGTVEFRLFEFKDPDDKRKNGLDAGRLRAYVLFCLAVNQKAKETKRSAPDGRNEGRENTYNRMWSWLYQLGMVEDEFAIVRKVFLNGLVRTPTEHHRNERESA